MRNNLKNYLTNFRTQNLIESNRYVLAFGIFWGICLLIITIIIGIVSKQNPKFSIEFVNETKQISHSFNITSAPTSAFICLGISIGIILGIYLYWRRQIAKHSSPYQSSFALFSALVFFGEVFLFHLIAFLLAYYAFYFPQLNELNMKA